MILIEKEQKYQCYPQVKIDKYKYLAGEEILPSGQGRILEQTKFTYSALTKAFEKQVKAIENQGRKEAEALKNHLNINKNQLQLKELSQKSQKIVKLRVN